MEPKEKKLRVIHTEASPHWGGQEIRIFEEMKWFRMQGHEMLLVTPSNATLYKRATEEGFAVISLYFTKNRTLLSIFQMMMIIKRFRPDVVATHSSTDSWAGLIAAKLMRVRKRVRYRHVSTAVRGNFLNRWQYRSLSNLIITTGECIRKPLIKTFQLPRIQAHSIPTGISLPSIMLSRSEARSNLQRELGLSDETRFIGQVSVLRSWKGHMILKDAFQRINEAFPNYHLVFVGGGPMEATLLKLLRDDPLLHRIHLVGHKPNAWPYFRALDVAVLASLSNEGIPQSLLQAMHAEIPVVGTDVGGIPEIVFHEQTGLLVQSGDAVAMSQTLQRFLTHQNLRTTLPQKARELVQASFQWDVLGKRLEALFGKGIDSSRSLSYAAMHNLSSYVQPKIHVNLGLKRRIVLFAQHSSWGAASNFNEMFNASGEYDSCEILHDDGGLRGYDFGSHMNEKKKIYGEREEIKELVSDPDAIFFLFDYNGLNLFRKCMSKMKEKVSNRAINIFFTGNPYIKHHEKCNKWVKKYNVRAYAMLDLLGYNQDALPLMQPYDIKKMLETRKDSQRADNNFVICHSPGHKGKENEKGSYIIEGVVSKIQKKHKNVFYKQLGTETWLSHDECIREKASSDVFIDKVGEHTAGGIGKSGIEGICLGIPTISSLHKSDFCGRYADVKVLNGNTKDDLERELWKLLESSDSFANAHKVTMESASVFDYSSTLQYLQETMAQ